VHTSIFNSQCFRDLTLPKVRPNTFPKTDRIVRSTEITCTLKTGECVADGVLVLFAMRTSTEAQSRLGVTIPKRTGNAVERNRWKRLIRESFRTQHDLIPKGFDYVIRPKKDATPSWEAIQRSVPSLARRVTKRFA
jgi:ribonuclease P protein component